MCLSSFIVDDGLVYVDLSSDPTLFQSRGDYQFDIYRHMKSHNRNIWRKFSPKTNVMWFHCLTTKLCCDLPELPSSCAASTCYVVVENLLVLTQERRKSEDH
uniref:non-specific serine/threonine protein kinase n=1 Tax=Trichobilharzia regenti TaxID=157069 RepID=A0AA85IUQ3_TRIRE|nr:unnamed protein product [Trichobilharzia regenti]